MQRVTGFRSRTVVIPAGNIDTDQIIPARFLTTTTKQGLGKQLFTDWRYLSDGTPNPAFILNKPEARGAEVLVAGRNFGWIVREYLRPFHNRLVRTIREGIAAGRRIDGRFAADHRGIVRVHADLGERVRDP